MGLPAKVLADDETALLVLRPHVRRLARPALVLLVLAPAAGYALGAVPAGATQATVRVVVAAVAAVVALRWVVWPFARWWTTRYVLTDERLFQRAGVLRRTGHDLPLRGVTDVVVAQRLGERLLRCGTLSVTTEGGAQFTMTDVPGVSRLQHGLLAVADDVTERLAAPAPRFGHGRRGSRARPDDGPGADEELGGRYLEIDPGTAPGAAASDDVLPDLDDDERERETVRRLRALQEQVRRTPLPDSPVEDDAAPLPAASRPAPPPPSDEEPAAGARILPFPPRQ
jgi:membrane protein YdbS with pleckstrin-like domain